MENATTSKHVWGQSQAATEAVRFQLVENGAFDDTVPAHSPGHEHQEAKAEPVEYLEAWRTEKVLSRYDRHSWWQGLEGPISERVGQVIIDRQIRGHKPAPTPRMLGVAAVLDRYFSLTARTPRSGDDIEARVSRIEAQLAQSNGDAAVSSVA